MDQDSNSIGYAPMSLAHHNVREVAALIYESAPTLFDVIFGARSIECLMALVPRSHNRFSHQYIRIAEINHQVVGIAILLPAEQLNHNADYGEILSFSQRLWLKLAQQFILRHLLRHDYPAGAFYLGNLAVASEYRNQGIGRQLLSQCINAAANSPIFISVDSSNGRTQKLYESCGFQVVDTKVLSFLGTTIGSRILMWSAADRPATTAL